MRVGQRYRSKVERLRSLILIVRIMPTREAISTTFMRNGPKEMEAKEPIWMYSDRQHTMYI